MKALITFVSAVAAVPATGGRDRESAHPGDDSMRILETDDNGDLDLYVWQRYWFDHIPLSDDLPFINCNCSESEETSCAARHGFTVENECESAATVTTDENNDLIFTVYNDDNCSRNGETYTLLPDRCTDQGQFKITPLSNWCIHSPSGPTGPFVVPMVQPKIYGDLCLVRLA